MAHTTRPYKQFRRGGSTKSAFYGFIQNNGPDFYAVFDLTPSGRIRRTLYTLKSKNNMNYKMGNSNYKITNKVFTRTNPALKKFGNQLRVKNNTNWSHLNTLMRS